MKRNFVLGLGCITACIVTAGCQTAGVRGTPTASAGNAWNTPIAKSNGQLGKPTPATQTAGWPTGANTPNLGAPVPAGQVTPAGFRGSAPNAFTPPNGFSPPPGMTPPDTGFAAPPPGLGSPPNPPPPGFDPPPGPGQINSLHPTPASPDFPAPPPPVLR